ncbi:hypothetical protein Hanom_Chr06g00567431 [Helianthus anomalus]
MHTSDYKIQPNKFQLNTKSHDLQTNGTHISHKRTNTRLQNHSRTILTILLVKIREPHGSTNQTTKILDNQTCRLQTKKHFNCVLKKIESHDRRTNNKATRIKISTTNTNTVTLYKISTDKRSNGF